MYFYPVRHFVKPFPVICCRVIPVVHHFFPNNCIKAVPEGSLHNEKQLLSRIATGDEKAFRILFDGYRDRLYYYTLRVTDSSLLAEDIVQDTFLKIWLHRDRLKEVTHFNAYIFRMVRNSVFSGLRRRALETTILSGKTKEAEAGAGPDELYHFKEVRTILQRAVDALPVRQRSVYILRRDEGRSIREIAQNMDISEITVKRHLTQAQKNLREVLEAAYPFDAAVLILIFGLLTR